VDDIQLVPALAGVTLDKFGSMKPAALAALRSNITLVPNRTSGASLLNAFDLNAADNPLPRAALPGPLPGLLANNPDGSGGFRDFRKPSFKLNLAPKPSPGALQPPAILLRKVAVLSLKSRLNLVGELSMLTGIVAGVMMGLVGLTSVPCITPRVGSYWGGGGSAQGQGLGEGEGRGRAGEGRDVGCTDCASSLLRDRLQQSLTAKRAAWITYLPTYPCSPLATHMCRSIGASGVCCSPGRVRLGSKAPTCGLGLQASCMHAGGAMTSIMCARRLLSLSIPTAALLILFTTA